MLSNQLPSLYQEFIHLSRYSRWREDLGRRETWSETVERLINFFKDTLKENHNFNDDKTMKDLEQAILDLRVMPSMRALMTAGPALARDHIAGYNCSFKL